MKATERHARTIQSIARDNDVDMTIAEATEHAQRILDQTADYYTCGDRSEQTRDDDFYYDAKAYFGN